MKPLDGIRVLEVANWLAAPGAGAMMADLGADVVKLEPPGGDSVRGVLGFTDVDGPRNDVDYVFQMDNRGKRSVAVALDRPEGLEIAGRLVEGVDVLLTNLLPRRQRAYGLDSAALFADREGLVHASLTGYGTTGEKADAPGFDITAFFGHAGVTSLIPGEDGPPRFRTGQGDHVTSLSLFGAVMAGLRIRDTTGENQAVEVSLMHTGAWTVGADYADALVNGRQPKLRSRHNQIAATHNSYPDSDDRWFQVVMPNTDHNWGKMCVAIDRPDVAADERFADGRSRYRNMAELVDLLDGVFRTRTRGEWGAAFDRVGVIWGPINDLPEAATDPQMRRAGVFATLNHPEAGSFDTLAVPMKFAGIDVDPTGLAPAVGEHTDEVLVAAGLSDGEIAELRSSGVVV